MSDRLFRQRPVYSANNYLWSGAPQPQAGISDPDSLTERGLRAKKRSEVISAIVLVLDAVVGAGLIIWAVLFR
jgi:hypothetical protein